MLGTMAKRMFPILAVIVLAAAVLGGGWLSARSKAAKREATISAIEEEMADHFFGNVVWHFRDQGMSEDAAWQRRVALP